MAASVANEVVLSGCVVEISALRYTPAGLPVLNFRLRHESRQTEAGIPREVKLEAQAVALGAPANMLTGSKLGTQVKLAGFLAAKGLRLAQPVLHVREIEFLEGTEDGIQTKTEI